MLMLLAWGPHFKKPCRKQELVSEKDVVSDCMFCLSTRRKQHPFSGPAMENEDQWNAEE